MELSAAGTLGELETERKDQLLRISFGKARSARVTFVSLDLPRDIFCLRHTNAKLCVALDR